jgi:hypothetical protein
MRAVLRFPRRSWPPEAALAQPPRATCAGLLVQVLDPVEESFPFDGRTRFESDVRASALFETLRAGDLRTAYRGPAGGAQGPAGATGPLTRLAVHHAAHRQRPGRRAAVALARPGRRLEALMLTLGTLGFTAPAILAALAALPILWWLLARRAAGAGARRFPGIALLLGLRERTPKASARPGGCWRCASARWPR